jgi:hypothetical protein
MIIMDFCVHLIKNSRTLHVNARIWSVDTMSSGMNVEPVLYIFADRLGPCVKNLKATDVTAKNNMESVQHFNKSVQDVIQKDITSTLLGMETVMKPQHVGETARVLGGDDFPVKLQKKYQEAGKPVCNELETILMQTLA